MLMIDHQVTNAPRGPGGRQQSERDDPRVKSTQGDLPIAFVGTYPPRRCGIATFTRDLAEAIAMASEGTFATSLAVTDPGGQYEYPRNVQYEIRQEVKGDYARAAEFVNYTDVRLVSLQHEHGIFGGDDGTYVLDFVTALRVPVIATLHTVLKRPSESQRAIVQGMARQCAGIVVMSNVAANSSVPRMGCGGRRSTLFLTEFPTWNHVTSSN